MGTARRRDLAHRAGRSALSLVGGFVAGLVVFVTLGAATDDAVFSALSAATVVAASRTLHR